MSVQVYIPTPFRRATRNVDRVAVEAPDVEAHARRAGRPVRRPEGPGPQRPGRGAPPREHLREQRGHRGAAGTRDHAQGRRRGVDHSSPGGRRAGPRGCADGDRGQDDPDSGGAVSRARPGRGRVSRRVLRRGAGPPGARGRPGAHALPQYPGRAPRARIPCGTRGMRAPPTSSIPRTCSPSAGASRRATGWPPSITPTSTPARTSRRPTSRTPSSTGSPSYPDAVYVVLSVLAGRVVDAAAFVWDAQTRDFVATDTAEGLTRARGRLRSPLQGRAAPDARRRQQPGAGLPRRGRHAVLRGPRRGRAARGRGRSVVRRLPGLVGPADPRTRRGSGGRGDHRSGPARAPATARPPGARSRWPS